MSLDSAFQAARDIRQPVYVGAVAVLIGLAVLIPTLNANDGDPSVFVGFGAEDNRTLEYAGERLSDIALREAMGHDGKFFFVQANDPLATSPAHHASALDYPRYRYQRMLYPLLAGVGGLLPPSQILWGLLIVNLVGLFFGAAWLAGYAIRYGMSPWVGLAFPLNPGVINELTIDGAGVLAFALLCGAFLAALTERRNYALALLALACLSRESMLVAAAGVALWYWMEGQRRNALLGAMIPAGVTAVWAAYLRLRIPIGQADGIDALDPPLIGVFKAIPTWMTHPSHLVVGIAVIICLSLLCRQVLCGRRDLMAVATVGFAVMALLLSHRVWAASFDISRAVAPALTAVVVNPAIPILMDRRAARDSARRST